MPPMRGGPLKTKNKKVDVLGKSSCRACAQVKYPGQIHMIRGNHEDPTINAIYGFRDECRRRLHEALSIHLHTCRLVTELGCWA